MESGKPYRYSPSLCEGIALATELMESGKLYRYSAESDETCMVSRLCVLHFWRYSAESDETYMVSRCEKALADYTGHKYCVALNSCGSAIFMALKCVGAQPGDKVLSNAFTFTAVPSAIVHASCEPVYVECTDNFLMDPEHLAEMADKSGAKFCLVSHMRGKVGDMDKISAICKERGIIMVEDCAHSLGVSWKGEHSGHFGAMACISSQSYKMLNSGEGGFLLTNDDELAAKSILYAGAYEQLYRKHLLRPADEIFERLKYETPNYSLRMHAVSAAIVLPQIATLDERIAVYNRRYVEVERRLNAIPHMTVPKQLEHVERRLNAIPHMTVPKQLEHVSPVCDSVQFTFDGLTEKMMEVFLQQCRDHSVPGEVFLQECRDHSVPVEVFLQECRDHGVPVEVFGARTNARYFRNWRYTAESMKQFDSLPKTEKVIQWTADVRLPLMFEDFDVMCTVLKEAMHKNISSQDEDLDVMCTDEDFDVMCTVLEEAMQEALKPN
ncbi:pyridoxal phosphate-dependent transferase [Baffinella frigidus]|nr:pyridoxal phosphate-dependent transferase [Cryptophyta sp. CCMP2293]